MEKLPQSNRDAPNGRHELGICREFFHITTHGIERFRQRPGIANGFVEIRNGGGVSKALTRLLICRLALAA